jgi:hypothetical protein
VELILGGAPISHVQLCEWIRRCNPSRLELAEQERERRYVRKAQLQSALICRFPAELEVRRTLDPGVVGVCMRGGRPDAGHVAIRRLSPEARAWIETKLGRATE